jgi:hypothetical protein
MPAKEVTVKANFVGVLDFHRYVGVKWNNTLILNIAQLAEDRISKPSSCTWYRDGVEVGSGDTYAASRNNRDGLVVGATYTFKIVSDGRTYYSTPYTHTLTRASAIAYPNPVRSGNMITIEGVAEGSPIQVFNQVGVCVSHIIATGETVTLTLNTPPGMYVIRTNNGDIKIIID